MSFGLMHVFVVVGLALLIGLVFGLPRLPQRLRAMPFLSETLAAILALLLAVVASRALVPLAWLTGMDADLRHLLELFAIPIAFVLIWRSLVTGFAAPIEAPLATPAKAPVLALPAPKSARPAPAATTFGTRASRA